MLRKCLTVGAISAALVGGIAVTPANAATIPDAAVAAASPSTATTPHAALPYVPVGSERVISAAGLVTPDAAGGGCSASVDQVSSCISWATGKGLACNFYVNGFNPVVNGGQATVDVVYEDTTTGTAAVVGLNTFVTNHTGVYATSYYKPPATHGFAFTEVWFTDKSGNVLSFSPIDSPDETW